ncbi:MAG: hypothetical protein IPL61_20990 [Myxococcales bacterium]|nr:hypothetical protein [Myxococcales bacterium]
MQPPAAPACLEQLAVEHSASVLSEQRRVGPRADDFQTAFAAAYLDPDVQVPVEAVRAYQIGATPLLWWNVGRTAAVVNAAVLSDLAVVDATRLDAGVDAPVGGLTELGLGKIGGRALVKFLLHARVIATYVHIGAELCLTDEHDGPDGYRVRVTGHHTYFTSSKHVVPLAFSVTVDPAGQIAVHGG